MSLPHYDHFINGAGAPPASGDYFDTDNPYTGQAWARIARGNAADVAAAVAAARAAFEGPWGGLTATRRGQLLRRLADLVIEHAPRLAEIEQRDNGKLSSEVVAQVCYMGEYFHYYAGLADKVESKVIPTDKAGVFTFTRYEAKGVVAIITPWNSPLTLTSWKLAPALAAGCTAVVKPSEFTSASMLEFAALFEQAGFPPGVVNVVTGFGAEVGEPLVSHPDVGREKAAQLIWTQLQEYIYKGTYEGWYCVGCESFVTAQQATANNGVCPDHNKPYEQLSEENYYFKLSAFGDQIRQALTAGEFKIVPEFRETEILNLIKEGLHDISISRPKKHLTWGIPVPGDDDQVMYVWFEALMNYITVLGYPNTENFNKFWPADVWVGGKDILRFHAAIFPAMLIGLNLPLQKTLLVHGHVLSGGAKMSKSVGNVVAPLDIIDTYGVDAFRYYFLRHVPTIDDGDFTWDKFENAYNNELGNELGNLVQRVVAMVNRYQQGVIGDLPRPEHDAGPYHEEVANLRIDRAIDAVWVMVRNLNIYLEEVKPWEIAKKPEDAEHLQEVLAYAAGSLQQIADLLWPFLPTTAETIRHIFEGGTVKQYQGVLFPKIFNHTQDPRAPKTAAPVVAPASEQKNSPKNGASPSA